MYVLCNVELSTHLLKPLSQQQTDGTFYSPLVPTGLQSHYHIHVVPFLGLQSVHGDSIPLGTGPRWHIDQVSAGHSYPFYKLGKSL